MPATVRAMAAQKAAGPFTDFEFQAPTLRPDQIEIKVESCGICHSDLSMLNNEWGMTQYPFVGGHEIVGTVAARGERVQHLEIGQRVGIGWYSGSCATCRHCLGGDHNLCSKREDIIAGRFGGFADRVHVQAIWAVPLPSGLNPIKCGPLFCGGITVFNPIVQMGVRPTDRVGVIGIGGLGHLALRFLNKWGCEVTAFTSSDDKAAEARTLGAHRAVNSRDSKAIQAEAGRFDFIISTVNVALDWDAYIAALAPKGRLHHVGAVLEPQALVPFALIGGQKQVSGTPLGAPATTASMLDFCARHSIEPQCEVFPLSKINQAFDHLRSGRARYRIVLENDLA